MAGFVCFQVTGHPRQFFGKKGDLMQKQVGLGLGFLAMVALLVSGCGTAPQARLHP